MNDTSAFDQLRRATSAYQESAILAAAAEFDLFTVILKNDNRMTADRIASTLQSDARRTAMLLDALAATGYLVKSNEEYSVAQKFVELLDSRTPETFVPMIRHLSCVMRSWVQLSWAVKEGKKPVRMSSILGEDEDRVSFIWAMNSVARQLAPPTVESLKQAGVLSFDKEEIRFIDIGGASGTYTQAFLEALPKSQGTLFDLPVGVAAARKRFTGSPLENRVTLVEGDFYKDEFPAGFDLAWISAIIHQHGREESRKLYEKAFRSLDNGGKIAVRDFIMNADRTSPRDGAYFGINMLVNTETGMVYTFNEVKEDLESVGFVDVELAVPAETMSAVVTARKPA